MILYIEGVSTMNDTVIDYIEATLKSGEKAALNWEESEWIHLEDGTFEAKLKGIYFGEEPANGREPDMIGLSVGDVGFYSEDDNGLSDQCHLISIEMYNGAEDIEIWRNKRVKAKAKLNLYYFTMHDSGGRVIENYKCLAISPYFAYKKAEKRGKEIRSHAINPCTAKWKSVENAYDYYHKEKRYNYED